MSNDEVVALIEMEELNDEQLAALKEGLEIEGIELVATWSDDHILCATVSLEFENGTRIEQLNLWWIGWQGLAAIEYADESERARQDFKRILDNQLAMF